MVLDPECNETFVLLPKAGSRKLVVFFSATGNKAGKFTFWNISKSLNENILFVSNGDRNEWYQHGVPGLGDTAEKTVAAIRDHARRVGAEQLYMIGVSMGGSGALLHGALAGAQVLAFGPETLLNLPHSRCRKFMTTGTTIPYPDISKLITPASRRILVVCGESDAVDIYCASTLEGIENVVVKTFIGDPHPVQVPLHNRAQLIPLIQDFVGDLAIERIDEEGTASKIPSFAEEYFKTHCAIADRNWEVAENHGRKAVSLHPTCEEANSMVGRALLSLGRARDAYPFLSAAVAIAPESTTTRFAFASCVRRLGDTELAILLQRRLIKEKPTLAKSYFEIGIAYVARNDVASARLNLQKAVELNPSNASYASKLKQLAEKQVEAA